MLCFVLVFFFFSCGNNGDDYDYDDNNNDDNDDNDDDDGNDNDDYDYHNDNDDGKKKKNRYPAEILYIFKDKFGGKWVETRWLYTKEEVVDCVPRSRRARHLFLVFAAGV